jgi:glycerol kinase
VRYVLGIDEGTTGAAALVVGEDGHVYGRGYREIAQYFPQPGWVEHDPGQIFEATCHAAREAIEMSGVAPECAGITNQRETVVVWNRDTGEPMGPAIVWQDRRTASRCSALAADAAEITRRTGLVLDPYFSATKLEWIRANRTESRSERAIAGTIDAWLIWKLTSGAVHATDPTNASRTMLYDIDAQEWSNELCALFDVPRYMLPSVRPSSSDFGVADARHFGLAIPILGVAGDQQAALYGHACTARGAAKNTYGTGAFLLVHMGSERPFPGDGMLATVACGPRGEATYAVEASIFIAGAAVQWLRDGLQVIAHAQETESLARSLHDNGGVYFVPALTGLGAPHWNAAARGMIVGLTRGSTRAHVARAALEAMAYGTCDVLHVIQDHTQATLDVLRVDGGAAANDWLMQFQADVLGVPVERPDAVETTALGAAALAGVASGVWADAEAFAAPRTFTRFLPRYSAVAREAYKGWQRALRATLAWAKDRA